MALPKANRLRQRRDFSIVYQQGIRRRSSYLTLRALRRCRPPRASPLTTELPLSPSQATSPLDPRIGISINLKVSKRAVVRNRIKRQLRSALRQLLPRLISGWDLVIVVHPEAVECDYLQFLQELEQLLIQAEVIDGCE